jgi:hypothetical protein
MTRASIRPRAIQKSERQLSREAVAGYHEAMLSELVRKVATAVDRYRDGELDAFEVDCVVPVLLPPRSSGSSRASGAGVHVRVGVMTRDRRRFTVSGVREAQSERLRRRRRWYFVLMGTCLALIVLAWNVVRLWSTTAAVAMSVVAAVLPPVAALIANWGEDH